jgi:hypothetical protein
MRLVFAALAATLFSAMAADLTPQLLSAAAAGKTPEVQTLLGKGAAVDGADKKGRTALMVAAQHGHAETVRLLLLKGAHADLRDRAGYTAYGLTLLDPAGRGDHSGALQALPKPSTARIAMDAVVAAGGLISSCYMPPSQLKQQVTNLGLDSATAKEIVDYARASGKGLVEFGPSGTDADAQVTIEIQPGAACEAQTGDSLNLNVDVRVYRTGGHQLLQEKHFAGGFKGLRKQSVDNVAQYAPVYQSWIKPQAGPMYWFIVETVYRTIR